MTPDVEYCATGQGMYLAVVGRTPFRGKQEARRIVTMIKADPDLPDSRTQHWALWRIKDAQALG